MAIAEATTTGSYASDFIQSLDLGGDPFNTGCDGDYFFPEAMRQNILDQLVHFCRFSNQLVVMTGPFGSGKTVLVDAAVAQLYSVIDCCRMTAQLLATPESILSELAKQLRFLIDEPISINEFLDRLSIGVEAEPILVIVEQAHDLEQEGVELLLELQRQSEGMVHLVLSGEEALQHIVDLAGVEEGEVKSFELPLLTEDEVGKYVQGRLRSVGYAGEQPLSNDQLAVLYEQSLGNFTRINTLVPRLLVAEKKETARFSLPLKIPTVHLLAIGVLIGALVLSYLYQGNPPVELAASQLPSGPAQNKVRSEEPLVVKQPGLPAKEMQPAESSAVGNFPPVVSDERGQSTLTANNDGAVKPEPAGLVVEANSQSEEMPAVVLDTVEESVEPVPVPEAAPVKAVLLKQPEKAAQTIPPRETRLLSLSEGNYMLQVLGSRNEQSARNFVKQYIGKLPITYFESQLSDKPWYVVLTGPYQDKPAAVTAIKQLPEALQRQKPWAKDIVSIQTAIRRHRGL